MLNIFCHIEQSACTACSRSKISHLQEYRFFTTLLMTELRNLHIIR